jgi:hypothetical protein
MRGPWPYFQQRYRFGIRKFAAHRWAGYHAALAASGQDSETIGLAREWSAVGTAVHVSETDEQAKSEAEADFIKNPSGAIARNADDMIYGSPDTVTRAMRAFSASGLG